MENKKAFCFVHLQSKEDPSFFKSLSGQTLFYKAVTIAYVWDRKTQQVFYTVAKCSPKDVFNKKIGRSVAAGRFVKYGPTYTLEDIFMRSDMYDHFIRMWHPDSGFNLINTKGMKNAA